MFVCFAALLLPTYQVPAAGNGHNGTLLDCRGAFKSIGVDATKQRDVQAHVIKGVHNLQACGGRDLTLLLIAYPAASFGTAVGSRLGFGGIGVPTRTNPALVALAIIVAIILVAVVGDVSWWCWW